MQKYRLISKKGEGTFSEVMKAQNVQNGKFVAIKCMKNVFRSIDQVNSLREIQALRRLNPHDNIIELEDVLYDKNSGRLALVFELMDMNIYEMITRNRKQYLNAEYVRILMWQLMKAIHHMHSNGIFHRDIKPENVLVRDVKPETVLEKVLKVADFGSCRGIHTKQPFTEYISTRWYRAPECLLTNGYYGAGMDIWGVGCVLFEIVALFPLFPGTNELDQIERVHGILGTPEADVLEVFKRHGYNMNISFPPKVGTGITNLLLHVEDNCVDLIQKLITYNPEKRPNSATVLLHPYFASCREAEYRAGVASSLHTLSPSNANLQLAQRKERRRKEAQKDKLPQLARGHASNGKVLKLKEKSKFNATAKDFSVSGNRHQGVTSFGGSKFKPSATINLGGGGGVGMSDDDDGTLSLEDGPFSDTDADKDGFSHSMRLGPDEKNKRKIRAMKKSMRLRKQQQLQQQQLQQQQQQQQEYYHIGIGNVGNKQNFSATKIYNQKKDANPKKKQVTGAALPSLANNSTTKNTVNKQQQKEEDTVDVASNSTANLHNLCMVTTQYKINKKTQRETQPIMLPGDKDKFSIHKSFAQPQDSSGSTLSEIVNVRKLADPEK